MTSSVVGCEPEMVKDCAGLGRKDELRGLVNITWMLLFEDLLIVHVMST